jgi:hypothetical protein
MPDLDYQVFMDFIAEILASAVDGGFDIGYGGGMYGGMTLEVGGESSEPAVFWYNRFMELCRESGTGPGNVNIVALMEDGRLASEDIRTAIYEICNDRTRRPLTDFVHVIEGEYIDYELDFTYWIDISRAVDAVAIQNAVNAAKDDYIRWQCGELGQPIVPDVLIRMCMEAGARRLEVRSPVYRNLRQGQVARLANPPGDIIYGGLERRL